jgi:hypothetical protein
VNAIVATADVAAKENILQIVRAYDVMLDSSRGIFVTGFILGYTSGATLHRCRDTPEQTLRQATIYGYNYLVEHPAFVTQLREYSAMHGTGY